MNAGDGATVVQAHVQAVRVENSYDLRVETVVAVVGKREGFGKPLGLVIDAARPDGVDVPPVRFLLRVLERIAVHLGGRCDHEYEARALGQCECQRVVCAEGSDFECLNRKFEVIDGTCGAGPVQHEVDVTIDVDMMSHVVPYQIERPVL